MSRKNKRTPVQPATVIERPNDPQKSVQIKYWWVIVIAVAAAARLLLYWQFSHSPLANTLFLDAALYDKWSASIVHHHAMSDGRPFFIEPGYAYFIALVKVLGGSTAVIRLLQIGIGIGICLVTALIAKQLGGDLAALCTGIVSALYLPMIYFEELVLKTTLEVFLVVLIVYLFMRTLETPRWLGFLLIGLLLGLTSLVRSNIFILVPVFIGAIYFLSRRNRSLNPLLLSAVLLAGIAPVLIAVGARNYEACREALFLPSNSGINFYIGNSKLSNGTVPQLPFLNYDPEFEETDSKKEAERRAGHALSYSQASSFWWSETGKEIAEDPGHWLRLVGVKVLLTFNHYEFTDNQSIYFMGRYIPMLRWPLPGYWLAMPLAFCGIFAAIRRRDPAWILIAAIIVVQMLGVVAFHFAERYRLASVPFMIALGVPAIIAGWQMRRDLIGTTSVGIAGLILAVLPNPVVPHGQPLYNHYDMLGMASTGQGNGDAAIAAFRGAVAENPRNTESRYNLALALRNYQHDDAGAEANLRAAIQSDPNYGNGYFLLGKILMDAKRFDEAADAFTKSAGTGVNAADSMISAGAAYGQTNRMDLAIQWLQKGLALKPNDPTGLEMLGNAYYMGKNLDLAKLNWQKALQAEPNNPKLRQNYQIIFKTAP